MNLRVGLTVMVLLVLLGPPPLPASAMPPDPQVPELLTTADGAALDHPDQWAARRQQILEHFRDQVYGRVTVTADRVDFSVKQAPAMNGRATRKTIDLVCHFGPRTFTFPCTLYLPASAPGPVPVVLFINNRSRDQADRTLPDLGEFWPAEMIVDRGFAAAVFKTRDVVDDDARQWLDGGLIATAEADADAPRPPDAWGAVAAWAWAAQRVMDYLETDPDVDPRRVALVGHSRGGKTALWAAANDDRFSAVVANMSGCTGAALSRHARGELIEHINSNFPHWFCDNYNRYNGRDRQVPYDQHQLLACIAPRGLYVASGAEDHNADPRGEFLSLAHASPAYALLGHSTIQTRDIPAVGQSLYAGPLAYHLAPGGHGLDHAAWSRFLDFFTRLWSP